MPQNGQETTTKMMGLRLNIIISRQFEGMAGSWSSWSRSTCFSIIFQQRFFIQLWMIYKTGAEPAPSTLECRTCALVHANFFIKFHILAVGEADLTPWNHLDFSSETARYIQENGLTNRLMFGLRGSREKIAPPHVLTVEKNNRRGLLILKK